jgi:hypothetical protein
MLSFDFGVCLAVVSETGEVMNGEDSRSGDACPMTTNAELEIREFTQHRVSYSCLDSYETALTIAALLYLDLIAEISAIYTTPHSQTQLPSVINRGSRICIRFRWSNDEHKYLCHACHG